jgi:hypothetical protein
MAPDPHDVNPISVCHGFRVEAGGNRLGRVEDILHGGDSEPAALLVRGGLFGTKTMIVPAVDVLEVVPRAKRVVARAGRPG